MLISLILKGITTKLREHMQTEEKKVGNFDLIYQGAAFHFIPAEIGYPKAPELLKSGGASALF
ncbi:MAG TPA: hypothetical protein PLG28_06385 [Bacillota bacterium]|nr:hypothetical protein [Bacillota bacterium]